jgi:hypothetical protein
LPSRVGTALAATWLAAGIALSFPTQSAAKVFYARDEMLAVAFPDADRVEPKDYILTPEQKSEIERRSKTPLESSLFTIYTGRKEGRILGWAILDTHVVRTLPETFLVVIAPDGSVAAIHVLAFYEPLEYLPGKRWLSQLRGRRLSEDLRVGAELAGITGSTLTSRAVVGGVRRALAAYEVLVDRCDSSLPESGRATDCSK